MKPQRWCQQQKDNACYIYINIYTHRERERERLHFIDLANMTKSKQATKSSLAHNHFKLIEKSKNENSGFYKSSGKKSPILKDTRM